MSTERVNDDDLVGYAKAESFAGALQLANDVERAGRTVIGIVPEVSADAAIASSVNHQLTGSYFVVYRWPEKEDWQRAPESLDRLHKTMLRFIAAIEKAKEE